MAKYRGSLRAWWMIPLLLICLSVQAGSKLIDNECFSIQSNYLGTPEVMYDADGKVVWSAELDAYGDVRELTGDRTDCPFRYQGQYEDEETGLYYNRMRFYSPEVGGYISQDPLSINASLRLYGYVHDLNIWIDVFGLLKIYRGVNENHYGYNDALEGKAKPKGGSANPFEHNQGNTNSKYTSWTTDPDVAKNYALRPKGEGVILEMDIDESKLVKSPNTKTVILKQSGVEVSESEVLIKGKVKGAKVEHVH